MWAGEKEFGTVKLSKHFHGQVVRSGAEASSDEHDIGFFGGRFESLVHICLHVADRGAARDVGANGLEVLGHPSRVGVDDLPDEQFVSDGDDVDGHV